MAGAHGGKADQHVPRGHEDEWDAGGLIKVECVGNRNDVRRGNGDQLAVAAVDGIAKDGELAALVLHSREAFLAVSAEVHGGDQDALAWRESGNVFADLSDLARDVAA